LAILPARGTKSILRAAHLTPETTSCESTLALKEGGTPFPFSLALGGHEEKEQHPLNLPMAEALAGATNTPCDPARVWARV